MQTAEARLGERGVGPIDSRLTTGQLSAAFRATPSDMTVLGKRGERSAPDRSDLGSIAAAALRSESGPLCLVSRICRPVHRGLVLIDADPNHRRTVETIGQRRLLADLELDIVMLQPAGVATDWRSLPGPAPTWEVGVRISTP